MAAEHVKEARSSSHHSPSEANWQTARSLRYVWSAEDLSPGASTQSLGLLGFGPASVPSVARILTWPKFIQPMEKRTFCDLELNGYE